MYIAVGYASDDINLIYTAVGYARPISQLAYTAIGKITTPLNVFGNEIVMFYELISLKSTAVHLLLVC